MHNINREILGSSLALKQRLEVYGTDKYNIKEDIILLSLIDDILTQNCYYEFLDKCSLKSLIKAAKCIRDSNPTLKYCRVDLNNYKNLGNDQNITTFQLIS